MRHILIFCLYNFSDFDIEDVINYPIPAITVAALWLLMICCVRVSPNRKDLPLFALAVPLPVEDRYYAFVKTQIGKEFLVLYSKSSKYSKRNGGKFAKLKRCCALFCIRCKDQSMLISIGCADKGSNYSTNERILALFVLIFTILAVSSFLFGVQQTNVCVLMYVLSCMFVCFVFFLAWYSPAEFCHNINSFLVVLYNIRVFLNTFGVQLQDFCHGCRVLYMQIGLNHVVRVIIVKNYGNKQ